MAGIAGRFWPALAGMALVPVLLVGLGSDTTAVAITTAVLLPAAVVLAMGLRNLERRLATTETALAEARALIANFDSLPAPVYTIDRELRVTSINPAAAALTHLSREECIGASCASLFNTPICHSRRCPAREVLATGVGTSGENFIDPEGLDLPVRYTVAPITDADDTVCGAIIHLADISQRLEVIERMQRQEWVQKGQVELADAMRGQQDTRELCANVVRFLVRYLDAEIGILYLHEDGRLRRAAAVGLPPGFEVCDELAVGEGICGKAALELTPIYRENLPPDYLPVGSATGRTGAVAVAACPLQAEGVLKGVIELAALKPFSSIERLLLDRVVEYIAIGISAAEARSRLQELLAESEEQRALLQRQREELARANAALEDKTRALEQSSRYKSEFLANMSHELRTPLNSMLVLSKTLAENRDGTLTPRQVEFARTIHQAGLSLLELIDEILDLSKIEAGKISLRPQPVDLVDLLDDLERMFGEVARNQGLEFSCRLQPDTPRLVVTDRQRLSQILKNFLANALKFTEKGEVRLEVERRDDKRGGPALFAFSVRDTGIGIPAGELDAIFDPFHQVDGSMRRRHGGSGLGLAICRKLAAALGGSIEVASRPGHGSTFTLVLPLELQPAGEARQVPGPPAADRPAPPEKRCAGRTVLLVDADMRRVFALAGLLEDAGARVVTAKTGHEGFSRLQETAAVDAVVLAAVLPDGDGREILKRIRRLAAADLPVIVLADRQEVMGGEAWLTAGATALLPPDRAGDRLVDELTTLLDSAAGQSGR